MRRTLFVLAGTLLLGAIALTAILRLLTPPRVRAPNARSWVFRNVTIVESGVPARPGSTLIVDDGRISRTGDPDRSRRERRQLAPDLDGLYVAPGLIDMHVHYPPRIAVGNRALWSLLLLAHGVTSIRETGSIDGSIFAERQAIESGDHPGPRIFACGRILDGPRPSFPSNLVVRTAEEARAAVHAQAQAGADCIKVYNMLEPGPLEAIVAAAASVGLPVIGHKPHSVPTRQAGIVDLQHGTGVVPVNRARIGRLDFRYEDWAALDEARLAEAIALSRALGIAHTPTLINSAMRRWLVGSGASPGQIAGDSGLQHLPRFWRGVWRMLWQPPYAAGDRDAIALESRFRRRQAEMTLALQAAGVEIHAGTDTLMPYVAPGSSLHGELRELEAAGIGAETVWRIATRDAGRFLRLPGLGRLGPGAPADLLFLARDPRGDLSALQDIRAVLAAGRLYRRAELDAALARYDAHFFGAFYEGVMGLVVKLAQAQFAPD